MGPWALEDKRVDLEVINNITPRRASSRNLRVRENSEKSTGTEQMHLNVTRFVERP